jgi:hypothetical protein
VTSTVKVTPRAVRRGGFLLSAALLVGLTWGPPATAVDKPRHDLTVSSEEVSGEHTNDFRLFGAVPTYKGRKLRIQSRVNGGPWRLWKTTPTDAEDGAFSEPIYGGKRGSTVCYKVVVPSTKKYRTTKRKAACIATS